MKFGTRAAESTNKGSSSGSSDWLNYFKDKETQMRFLEEMDDWTEVWMHWSPSKMRSYPCTDDFDTCPGHASENEREQKAAKKYIVNALTDGYVNAWILPGSLWEDLDRFKDKAGGTITDRDYVVVKKDMDNGIRYSVDREDRDRIDLSKYETKKRDHQKMLHDVFVEVWGKEPEEYSDPKPATIKTPKVEKKAETPTPESGKSWADKEFGDPPSEPQPEQDAAAGESEKEISEDELRAMSAPQIKALFSQCGLEAPETNDVDALADLLIEKLG